MKLALITVLLFSAICCAGEPKVLLHLLDHTGKEPTGKKFWIDWSENWRAIEKTKKIEGEDAQAIIDQLKISLKGTKCMNLCGHDPIYGIVARNKDGKTIKTSLCFKCGTWVKPGIGKGQRLDIKGKYGVNNPLCLVLRKHIELPEELLKPKSEQDGADQPATAPESKPEGSDKPEPESEVRSQ